ncbi:tyrosine--tRNA ligase [Candidatus Nomurabacteria bacterium CG1_02_43_90]|uniref:Tyrosine--tRNA ligase n=1 Tax=Candidatus Nomurabacteria bacterium CG1_02_43_90 TaxID=1805281 RepID=A0A1J4V2K6_9BACT|nr:MAG: tyrosine--tRNA ligase [Candidatus Nomurabacteria bacterium CG1_02_43_90]
MTLEEKINDLLTSDEGTFIDPQGSFKEKLLKKAKGEYSGEIIIKFGVDPTRPDIHLGHAVVLQKLRKFQDLGCKVIFLVGDFTASIGDPTGKSKVRPELEQQEIESNMNTYLSQVGKILLLDPAVFSWIRNSDWFYGVSDLLPDERLNNELREKNIDSNSFLGKAYLYEKTRMQVTELKKKEVVGITLRGLFWTLGRITHAQLIERDMFQNRLKEGSPLFVHEMLYPILQGVDSLALYNIYGACDLEIGGTDQTFNMLMGREVMKINKQPEQAVISMEILVGLDGKEKMSKSLGNYVGITDEPHDMFGKIMSIPDLSMISYYKLCTSAEKERIQMVEKKLRDTAINPRDVKLDLAEEITAIYHGAEKAKQSREAFLSTFQKKEIPEEIEELKMNESELFSDLFVRGKIVSSKSDWRRLVEEGAVKHLRDNNEEEKITNYLESAVPGVYKIGKRRFVKII